MTNDLLNADGTLTERGMDTLAHEAAHVWQFQTDGASYIGDAVISYADEDAAYDFTTVIENMTPWDEMTPDQQAVIAMVIGEALETNPAGELNREDLRRAIDHHNGGSSAIGPLTDVQFGFLQNIRQILLTG